jgi:hypothetical protein
VSATGGTTETAVEAPASTESIESAVTADTSAIETPAADEQELQISPITTAAEAEAEIKDEAPAEVVEALPEASADGGSAQAAAGTEGAASTESPESTES